MIRLAIAAALVFAASAAADEGWTGYGGPGFTPVARPDTIPTIPDQQPADPTDQPASGLPGQKGDKGDPGPKGDKGDPGPKGDSADLCQNIPGTQTVPGLKYNAQRYWSFKPKWEKRYLAINGKGQLVCVTLPWIRAHHALKAEGFKSYGAAARDARKMAAAMNGEEWPTCQVKDPPFAPEVRGGHIVSGQIAQRCQRQIGSLLRKWIPANVWKLGAYGCLQARSPTQRYWRNVQCESNTAYYKSTLVLFIDDDTLPMPPAHEPFYWRVTGYVWVDYEPAVGGYYKSKTVTSAFLPLWNRPALDHK